MGQGEGDPFSRTRSITTFSPSYPCSQPSTLPPIPNHRSGCKRHGFAVANHRAGRACAAWRAIAKSHKVRGMKEELRGCFRSLQNCNENGDQLITFLPKSRELFWRDDLSVDEQFKPVSCLLKLAERIAALCDKLCLAASAIRLAIVCSD